jgi:MerR family transcriptional regulator, light-induced transcriptional regulator
VTNSYRVAEQSDCERCEDFGLTFDLVSAQTVLVPKPVVQPESHLHDLATTIESSIIPRLLLSHGLGRAVNDLSPISGFAIGADSVSDFAALVISEDNYEAMAFVEGMLSKGVPIESILLDLMAPAARLMGEMWTADLCSFVDVTLGLSRIQQMLRQLRGIAGGQGLSAEGKGRALLVPAPGEQHTFGLRVVEEFLMRDGWEVRSNLRANHEDIMRLASEEHYDFIGFSVSGERLIPSLQSAIEAVREVSRNRNVRIMVGGVVFAAHPEFVKKVRADAAISDAYQAVAIAGEWYEPAKVN